MRWKSSVRRPSARPIFAPSRARPCSMFQTTVSFSITRCVFSSGAKRCAKETARSVSKASVAPEKSGQASSTMQPSDSSTLRCGSSTAVTSGSTGNPPKSRVQATRTFLKLRLSGRAKRLPGSLMETGERASGPAMAESRNAVSATVRAIGPSDRLRVPGVRCGPGRHAARGGPEARPRCSSCRGSAGSRRGPSRRRRAACRRRPPPPRRPMSRRPVFERS